MVVKYTKLEHPGGIYIYRVHHKKLDNFCEKNPELIGLKEFMNSMFDSCPDEYFGEGPRGSSLKFKTEQELIELRGHKVCELAKHGLKHNEERFKSNHSKVQLFMLENDNDTVAIEVPVWLDPEDISDYQSVFKSNQQLTGHIDVLSIEEGNVWVWDYKPNAHKEKYADTQVYFYSLMLSKRTGIPLEKFRCGYFDAERAYVFQPKEYKEINRTLTNY